MLSLLFFNIRLCSLDFDLPDSISIYHLIFNWPKISRRGAKIRKDAKIDLKYYTNHYIA